MNPSPNLKSGDRVTSHHDEQSRRLNRHDEDQTLATLNEQEGIHQNADFMRQILEELQRINSSNDLRVNQSAMRNMDGSRLKDVGAAYAVVAVFIASIDVGLLTYAHDYFSDRPDGTPVQASDSAINILWFLSIIFAGIAAMQFAVMQVFSSAAPSSHTENTTAAGTQDVSDIEKGRNDTSACSDAGTCEARTRNPVQRARQRFVELHSAGVTAIVLLMLSMMTLFTGILIFVWSDQPKAVGIIVTVFFGLTWILPKIPSSFFLSTASLLGL
ncbi:hypothetical protein SCHPADRAFT_61032 [Schizopora paradoxa]|uniref:PGG domain-containing protein n=1 Tax=Schizopora paradoxa TaxID=27342 RepID=A0A0H2SQU5_9AGAM|nr:hypothetical protein SCHPADRAFT_61032 [Schizopora paradoxa]